jgi:2-polyprenyl-3-methyl-5-hydroxy-6-metoxy-1,4-benzoquinol methylase
MDHEQVELSDDGERVVASIHDWNYYSHLSVYRFAAPMMRNLHIADAGCGTGYGASYLAEKGAASVLGLDVSSKAIAYCQKTFKREGLAFEVADLSATIPATTRSLDAIFSSQAMEHLADVEAFFNECRRVLKPNGFMVIAVPAIVTPGQLLDNIWNKHHITNLTPLGWYTKANRSFRSVTSYRHWPSAPFAGWEAIRAGLLLDPDETLIRETDYDYTKTPIDILKTLENNLNTVLVVKGVRKHARPPNVAEFIPHSWSEGAMHAKVRHEETELLKWKLWEASLKGSCPVDDGRSS